MPFTVELLSEIATSSLLCLGSQADVIDRPAASTVPSPTLYTASPNNLVSCRAATETGIALTLLLLHLSSTCFSVLP